MFYFIDWLMRGGEEVFRRKLIIFKLLLFVEEDLSYNNLYIWLVCGFCKDVLFL